MKSKILLASVLIVLSANMAVASLPALASGSDILDSGSISFRPPGYPDNRDYGPGRTARWYQVGSFRLPKLLEQEFTVDINGRFVNEIYFTAADNSVNIRSVVVQLSNGQTLDAYRATGTLRQGQRFGFRLDRYYSLPVERIIVRASSPNLIGSRGSLVVNVGLAN